MTMSNSMHTDNDDDEVASEMKPLTKVPVSQNILRSTHNTQHHRAYRKDREEDKGEIHNQGPPFVWLFRTGRQNRLHCRRWSQTDHAAQKMPLFGGEVSLSEHICEL